MCINNEQYRDECLYYISHLQVPDGYEIEILTITDAQSMTAGYNQAMTSSDAKYKIYLHQDVFLVDTDLLSKLLKLFENPKHGMVGMVGTPHLAEHGVMWFSDRIGKIYTSNIYLMGESVLGEIEGEFQEAEAVDGLFMATQYDLPWREDLFRGWDFYDISQSMEFRRQGYQVIVPNMEHPWCLHDDGFMNLLNYYGERQKFIQEYAEVNK